MKKATEKPASAKKELFEKLLLKHSQYIANISFMLLVSMLIFSKVEKHGLEGGVWIFAISGALFLVLASANFWIAISNLTDTITGNFEESKNLLANVLVTLICGAISAALYVQIVYGIIALILFQLDPS